MPGKKNKEENEKQDGENLDIKVEIHFRLFTNLGYLAAGEGHQFLAAGTNPAIIITALKMRNYLLVDE